jgi:hypothetical protein
MMERKNINTENLQGLDFKEAQKLIVQNLFKTYYLFLNSNVCCFPHCNLLLEELVLHLVLCPHLECSSSLCILTKDLENGVGDYQRDDNSQVFSPLLSPFLQIKAGLLYVFVISLVSLFTFSNVWFPHRRSPRVPINPFELPSTTCTLLKKSDAVVDNLLKEGFIEVFDLKLTSLFNGFPKTFQWLSEIQASRGGGYLEIDGLAMISNSRPIVASLIGTRINSRETYESFNRFKLLNSGSHLRMQWKNGKPHLFLAGHFRDDFCSWVNFECSAPSYWNYISDEHSVLDLDPESNCWGAVKLINPDLLLRRWDSGITGEESYGLVCALVDSLKSTQVQGKVPIFTTVENIDEVKDYINRLIITTRSVINPEPVASSDVPSRNPVVRIFSKVKSGSKTALSFVWDKKLEVACTTILCLTGHIQHLYQVIEELEKQRMRQAVNVAQLRAQRSQMRTQMEHSNIPNQDVHLPNAPR